MDHWGEFELDERRLDVNVFGIAGALNAQAAGLVFSLLIFILVLLEIIFSKAEDWAYEHETNELFNKLKKELTMLGIVSFLTFIYTSATNMKGTYYEAFEMSHIVILFIAFAFILQASFLLDFAFKEGDRFIYSQRQRPVDLIEQYERMLEEGDTEEGRRVVWFFVHAPFWVPTFPNFRQNIENKLIEKLFKHQHKLDEEFRFAHYMSKLFSKYISELGEVSPTSWFMLAILILLNIARIAIFDQSYEGLVCPDFSHHASDHESHDDEAGGDDDGPEAASWVSPHILLKLGGVRVLGESEGGGEGGEEEEESHPVCYEFVFQYSIVVSFMLLILMVIIFIAASYYHDKMLKEVLLQVGLEWKEEEGRAVYIEVLKMMAEEEDEARASGVSGSRLANVFGGRRGSMIPGQGGSAAHRPSALPLGGLEPKKRGSVFSVTSPIHSLDKGGGISKSAKAALSGSGGAIMEGNEDEDEDGGNGEKKDRGGPVGTGEAHDDALHEGSGATELSNTGPDKRPSAVSTTDTTEYEDHVISQFQLDSHGGSPKQQPGLHKHGGPNRRRGSSAESGGVSDEGEGTSFFKAIAKLARFISSNVYGEESEGKLDRIFLFESPDLFFFCVEYSLLLQCLYIAVWSTQLVPLLTQSPGRYTTSVGWGFGLTIPMVLNILIIQRILSRSVMLKAACGVHPHVLGEVNEEALEEEDCLNTLSETVRKRLEAETNGGVSDFELDEDTARGDMIPPQQGGPNGRGGRRFSQLSTKQVSTLYKVHLKKTFDLYDDDGSGAIGKKEFRQMLDDLGIYLSRKSFKILWLALDEDMSSEVTWDELFVILFPELKAEMKAELAVVNKLRHALGNRMEELGLRTKEQKLDYMLAEFNKFDADGSGTIDVDEMELLVKEYVPKLDRKQSRQLFTSIDIDGEGGVEWTEFRDLFVGIDEAVSRAKINWF